MGYAEFMIVQLVIKGLFLYFIFVVVRNLLRGAKQVKSVKDQFEQMKAQANQYQQQGFPGQQASGQGSKKSAGGDDAIEAEFRHL